jgi:hypothetical protein
MTTALLSTALRYAERGWCVLPLHSMRKIPVGCTCPLSSACEHMGKHPRISKWPNAATTDPASVREWWREWPDANIGIATGLRSNLLVLDVDNKGGKHGQETLDALSKKHSWIPQTYRVRTGTGIHLYFLHPREQLRAGTCVLGEGLDVQGDGRYIVAPPSLHSTGRRYECETPGAELRVTPEWVVDALATTATITGTGSGLIPEGERNSTLASIAGRLRRQGADAEQIDLRLRSVNATRCEVPLGEAEVAQIAQSIARYPITSRPEFFWIPFYMNEWTRELAVRTGKDYHRGWLVELWSEAWQRGGMLPDDPDLLYQFAKASSKKKFLVEGKTVLCGFESIVIDGRRMLVHPFLTRLYAEKTRVHEKKVAAGRRGGLARGARAENLESG